MATPSRSTRNVRNSTSGAAIAAAQKEAGVSLQIAGIDSEAKALADKISPDTIAEFNAIIDSDEYNKIVGLLLAGHIRRDFTAEEIAAAPRCILRKDAEEYYKANRGKNALDWKPVKDGKKEKWVSYFDTILEATPFIVDLRKQIEDIDNVLNNRVGFKQALKLQFPNEADQKREKAKLAKRITNVQGKWRTSWRVVQQEDLFEDLLSDAVNLAFDLRKDGTINPGPTPVYLEKVQEKGIKGQWDNFSVTQFLSLKPEVAIATREKETPSATWEALIKTLERVDEDEDGNDPDNIQITNAKQFWTGMASTLHLLQGRPEFAASIVKLLNGTKDIQDVAPSIITICELANEFGALKAHLQKRYEIALALEAQASGNVGGDPKLAAKTLATAG